jgi:heterodisulfide reductase subunit A
VVYTTVNRYTCSEPGQQEIKRGIVEQRLDRVVVASCTPRNYEPIFRECVAGAGLNPYLMTMANIREGVSWVHSGDVEAATRKAQDVVAVAVARARWLQPLQQAEVAVTPGALVIGGGIAGIQAALDLADAGHRVTLVEKAPSIGGKMAQLDKTFPTMDCSI